MHVRAGARATALVLLAALAACATTGGGSGRITSRTLSHDELAETPWTDLYDVLRNHSALEITRAPSGEEVVLLANRGGQTSLGGGVSPMLLVLDGTRVRTGVPDVLRGLRIENVEEVRILRPAQAGSRYGSGSQGGVLVVTTRR